MIDGFILGVSGAVIGGIIGVAIAVSGVPANFIQPISFAVGLMIGAAYHTLMIALCGGRTLGKMAAGIAVIEVDGNSVGFGRAFARWVCWSLPSFPYMIAVFMFQNLQAGKTQSPPLEAMLPAIYLLLASIVLGIVCFGMAGVTPLKRAMHDYLAGTRVIYPAPVETWRKALVIGCTFGVMILIFVIGIVIGILGGILQSQTAPSL